TEMTNITAQHRKHILYDAHCVFCTDSARRLNKRLLRRGWTFTPIQTPWARQLLGLNEDETPAEMALIAADGHVLHGVDALLHLCREIPAWYPIHVLACIPFMRPILR